MKLRLVAMGLVLTAAVVAGLLQGARHGVFVARSGDDVAFQKLRLSLRHVGDEVSLGPLVRDALRVCLIPPYVFQEDLERAIGAEIAEEALDFTVWESWWGLALKDPNGVRVVKGRDSDGDYDRRQVEFCWDDPRRLRMILVDADRRRVVRLSH